MTVQADEGALGGAGAQGAPTPSVPSASPGDKLPSTPSGETPDVIVQLTQLAGEVRQFREDLPTIVQREIQGTKDRRFRVLQGIDPDQLLAFSEYLKKHGNNVENAIREMQLDALLVGGERPSGPVQGSPGRGEGFASGEDMGDISARILTEAGIPFKDPGYGAFVTENEGKRFTARQWEDGVRAFALKRVRQSTAPAGSLVPESGPPPPPANLQQEYDKELAALKGSRNYKALMDLRRKYRGLGLNV